MSVNFEDRFDETGMYRHRENRWMAPTRHKRGPNKTQTHWLGSKVLCETHGVRQVVGFPNHKLMVLECGCKRGLEQLK